MIKKSDLYLLAAVLVIGIAAFVLNATLQGPGAIVKVVSGHGLSETHALDQDKVLEITMESAVNVIEISNGTVEMKEANCIGGDCLRQHAISRTGQSIICLPNLVLITIEGADSDDFDSIVH